MHTVTIAPDLEIALGAIAADAVHLGTTHAGDDGFYFCITERCAKRWKQRHALRMFPAHGLAERFAGIGCDLVGMFARIVVVDLRRDHQFVGRSQRDEVAKRLAHRIG